MCGGRTAHCYDRRPWFRAPARLQPPFPPLLLTLCLCVGSLTTCSAETDNTDEDTPKAGDPCLDSGTDGATATCRKPTREPSWYVDQANQYFDTLDTDADPDSGRLRQAGG